MKIQYQLNGRNLSLAREFQSFEQIQDNCSFLLCFQQWHIVIPCLSVCPGLFFFGKLAISQFIEKRMT